MDSENAPCITAVRSDLLTEAGRQSCVPDWKSRLGQPFPSVVGCNGLLRSGNQVLFFRILVPDLFAAFADDLNYLASKSTLLTTLLLNYLVELIVKLGKLRNLLHHFFAHEKWSAKRGVALDGKFSERQLNQSLLKEDSRSLLVFSGMIDYPENLKQT